MRRDLAVRTRVLQWRELDGEVHAEDLVEFVDGAAPALVGGLEAGGHLRRRSEPRHVRCGVLSSFARRMRLGATPAAHSTRCCGGSAAYLGQGLQDVRDDQEAPRVSLSVNLSDCGVKDVHTALHQRVPGSTGRGDSSL